MPVERSLREVRGGRGGRKTVTEPYSRSTGAPRDGVPGRRPVSRTLNSNVLGTTRVYVGNLSYQVPGPLTCTLS